MSSNCPSPPPAEEEKETQETRETRKRNAEMYEAFTRPTSLQPLFLDPQRYAHNWVEALIFHQDQLPTGSQLRQAFHLGNSFRMFLGDVHRTGSWWPYALVAILVFLFHCPPSRVMLRARDAEFLCGTPALQHNARTLLDAWLMGKHPTEGRFLVSSDEAHMNHTIALAYHLLRLYRAQWMLGPDEEKQLPHAQLCAVLH